MASNFARMPYALINVATSLQVMAECHKNQNGSTISEDYVLREYWLDIMRGLRGMLNSDCDHLDCGHFDSRLCSIARENGFTDEEF